MTYDVVIYIYAVSSSFMLTSCYSKYVVGWFIDGVVAAAKQGAVCSSETFKVTLQSQVQAVISRELNRLASQYK